MKQRKNIFGLYKEVSEWIISYVVVLLIPILICSVFFVYSFFVTWEENKGANTSALQFVADEIDDIFNRALKMEYNIQNNGKLNVVSKLKGKLSLEDYYKIVVAREECEQYDVWDEAISSYGIFLPEIEIFFGQGNYRDLAERYELTAEEYGISVEKLKDLLFTRHEKDFFVNEANNTICYITTIPRTGTRIKMNVIVELDSHYIQNILASMDYLGNSGIIIADEQNQILASRNVGTIDVGSIDIPVDSTSEYHSVKINGEKMLLACVESKAADLKYISIIPHTDFWHKALQNLSLFLLAFLGCIVFGTAAAWFFANIKYKTYGQLNYIIKEKLGNKESSLSVIRQREIAGAIRNMVDEYECMQKKLEAADSVKREAILSSIMEGRIRSESIEGILQANGLHVNIGNYVLMLFKVNRLENLFDKGIGHVSVKEMENISELVTSIVKELTSKKIDSEIININENIVCIINWGTKNAEDCFSEIGWITDFTKKQFESLKIQVTVSFSNLHNEVYSLGYAYAEVLRVLEYQYAEKKDGNSIMNYSDMLNAVEMNYLFTLDNEVELVNCLNLGKKEEAIQLVRNICEKNILLSKGEEELLNCLTWDLVACLLKFENSMKGKDIPEDTISWLEDITKSIYTQERVSLIEERIRKICQRVNRRKENKDVIWANQIEDYVQKHYQNPNLSNGEIAEYFRMNSAYMSTVFKTAMGINLMDYIHQVRVDKAKELLKNTDMTVEQISIEVGCSGGAVLRRLFKKCEGISPIQYKENSKL